MGTMCSSQLEALQKYYYNAVCDIFLQIELSNNDSRPTWFLTSLFNPFYNNVNSTTAVSYLSRSDFNKLHCVSVLI